MQEVSIVYLQHILVYLQLKKKTKIKLKQHQFPGSSCGSVDQSVVIEFFSFFLSGFVFQFFLSLLQERMVF
jgi:hypothetical protein